MPDVLTQRTRREAGQVTITGPRGVIERETLTCRHCGCVWVVRGMDVPSDPGGWCRLCTAPICAPCSGKPCEPFEEKLERLEARARSLRSMGF